VQIFLDRIFQSLSQRDSLDIAKFRLRKANEDRGGAAFAITLGPPSCSSKKHLTAPEFPVNKNATIPHLLWSSARDF